MVQPILAFCVVFVLYIVYMVFGPVHPLTSNQRQLLWQKKKEGWREPVRYLFVRANLNFNLNVNVSVNA